MNNTIYRIATIMATTGMTRSTIYSKWKHDPTFPKRIKLSTRCMGVLKSELDAWIEAQIAKRDGGVK